jgi:hypothetical protein
VRPEGRIGLVEQPYRAAVCRAVDQAIRILFLLAAMHHLSMSLAIRDTSSA